MGGNIIYILDESSKFCRCNIIQGSLERTYFIIIMRRIRKMYPVWCCIQNLECQMATISCWRSDSLVGLSEGVKFRIHYHTNPEIKILILIYISIGLVNLSKTQLELHLNILNTTVNKRYNNVNSLLCFIE